MSKMFCITTLQNSDQNIESDFNDLLDKYLDYDDSEHICGYDNLNTSIYLVDIEDYKAIEIIDFFKNKKLLVKAVVVENIIKFILSDQKLVDLYNDERNNIILNRYIIKNTSVDDVLERLNEVELNNLLPIELDILNGDNINIDNKQYNIVETF